MSNNNLARYTDKTVLVTGAGSGIGQATALRLLKEDANVIAVDITAEGLKKTAALASDIGLDKNITLVTADISDEQSVKTNICEAVKNAKKLDVLVNAAGIIRTEHTHKTSLQLWNEVITVNLTGTFLVTKELIPFIVDSKGVVVNFSSTSASFAHPYMAAYAASKGGIQSFTHTIASEYSKQGVRAVSVVPGGVQTGITNNLVFPKGADQSLYAKLTPGIGEGLVSPDAIAGVIAMLASEDGSFITGTEIRIDGGTHM